MNWFRKLFKLKTVYILLPNGQLWKCHDVPRNKETEVITQFINFPSNKDKGFEELPVPMRMNEVEVSKLQSKDVSVKYYKTLFTFVTQFYGGKYA